MPPTVSRFSLFPMVESAATTMTSIISIHVNNEKKNATLPDTGISDTL